MRSTRALGDKLPSGVELRSPLPRAETLTAPASAFLSPVTTAHGSIYEAFSKRLTLQEALPAIATFPAEVGLNREEYAAPIERRLREELPSFQEGNRRESARVQTRGRWQRRQIDYGRAVTERPIGVTTRLTQESVASAGAAAVQPKVGVVTVLFNSAPVLAGFFSSLETQEFQDFHVWAIDNASTDGSAAQCRAQGSRFTVVANEKNMGVVAGNNQGIHAALHAGCEYILLLNNDVEFGTQLFSQLIDGLRANHCEMVAPVMYYFDRPGVIWAAGGKFQPLFGYRCYHLSEGARSTGQFGRPHRVQHAPTCCVLFARSVFDRVGFMDERYFVYHDDTDFMLRCLKGKQRLFLLPEATLLHKVSELTGGAESEFSVRMGTRNRIYMLTKFLGRVLALPYVAGMWCTYLLRRILGQYTRERYALKRESLRQGFAMAPNWLPYRSPSL